VGGGGAFHQKRRGACSRSMWQKPLLLKCALRIVLRVRLCGDTQAFVFLRVCMLLRLCADMRTTHEHTDARPPRCADPLARLHVAHGHTAESPPLSWPVCCARTRACCACTRACADARTAH